MQVGTCECNTADGEVLFGTPEGTHIGDSAPRRRCSAAVKAAGSRHPRFHDLRHTFGTRAVQVFPLSEVQAYMRHAQISTPMIYVHQVPRNDAAAGLSTAISAGGGEGSGAATRQCRLATHGDHSDRAPAV
jgi:integrase